MSATKAEGDNDDDIDRLEADVPQGHMKVVVLRHEADSMRREVGKC